MSTEISRRLAAIEKRVLTATPCTHPMPLLINPTAEELEAAEAAIAGRTCCSTPRYGVGPALIVVTFPIAAQ